MRGKTKRLIATDEPGDDTMSVATMKRGGAKVKRKMVPKFLRRQRPTSPMMMETPAMHYASTLRGLRNDVGSLRVKLDEVLATTRTSRGGGAAPRWAALLVDESYAKETCSAATTPLHVLHLAVSYCSCLNCLADDVEDDSIPSVPSLPDSFDALSIETDGGVSASSLPTTPSGTLGIPQNLSGATTFTGAMARVVAEEEPPAQDECPLGANCVLLRAEGLASLWQQVPPRAGPGTLPFEKGLLALSGGVAVHTQVDLATVRRRAVRFTGVAQELEENWSRYFHGPNQQQVIDGIREVRLPDFKTQRRVVLHGTVYRFGIDAGALPATGPTAELNVAVCFRRQTFVIVVGSVAIVKGMGDLEDVGADLIMGFGEDPRGACDVEKTGTLDEARRLGLSEMLVHLPLENGDMWEVVMK